MKTVQRITKKTVYGAVVILAKDLLCSEDPYYVDADGDVTYFSNVKSARKFFKKICKAIADDTGPRS